MFMKNLKKKAQSLIEYGLILALVAIVALTILTKFSASTNKVGNNADAGINGAADNAQNNFCKSAGVGYTYNKTTGVCDAPTTVFIPPL